MESSRCPALFMAALFLLYRCRFKDRPIVLARGSCDIFPTQRLAFDQSDIVLPQRLVLARGPMISSSSLFFVLRVSSDDRSFNINFLSLLEVFRSTFSSSFILM